MRLDDFIDMNDNTMLSKMNSQDRSTLIRLLYNYKLCYRDFLNLQDSLLFGVEIEADYADKREIACFLIDNGFKKTGWDYKKEDSLHSGIEIVSPKMYDNKRYWSELKDVCGFLRTKSVISEVCGAHIHFDSRILKNKKENIINMMKVWAAYENIIFRFGYGEFLNARPGIITNAEPLAERIFNSSAFENYGYEDSYMNGFLLDFNKKHQAINLSNIDFSTDNIEKNTIEIRVNNGTINEINWQNFILFGCRFLLYSVGDKYDDDIIRKRIIKNRNILSNLDEYEKLDIDGALELSDLLFNNNLEKLNFLKIYLKNMKTTRVKNHLIPAKTLKYTRSENCERNR